MATPRKEAHIRLSPPEATYFNEIKFSVGNDPFVRVEPLREIPGGHFVITLHVRGKQKARALATLLVRTKQIGNLRILVRVRTTEGNVVQPISRTLSPREIANLYRVAFRTNGVAAFVFRDVLRNTINRTPILFSTARKKTGSTNYRK